MAQSGLCLEFAGQVAREYWWQLAVMGAPNGLDATDAGKIKARLVGP
jgi:hypothetical protein